MQNVVQITNILSTTHPLEKSQNVQSRTENKADSTSGSFHKSVTTRFFAKKESSLPIQQHGVKGPSEFVSQGVSNGVNSGFHPRPFAPAVYSRSHQHLSASEFLHGEQFLHWDVPYGANPYFAPRPLASNVWQRSQPQVNGMAGPSQLMYWNVPYGENSCFVPCPFVPPVSRRSEQHVNGVEGSQMMYWDASYGANLCYVPRPIAPFVSSRRKLLVLDINGLLADIVMPPPKGCRADKHILGRAVFKRPFYYEFLVFCCERFDVGIWSSRSKMGSVDNAIMSDSHRNIFQLFLDFMTRITKFEELLDVGNRFLISFQQGLELLRRPPIDMKSELVGQIMKANQSKRLSAYVEAGCVNTHDSKQNLSNLRACHLGLLDCLNQATLLVKELECLLDDATSVIENYNDDMWHLQDEDLHCKLFSSLAVVDEEEPLSDLQKPEITYYATLIGVIYGMIRQEYIMQEKIISSLSLTTSYGELESYCLMWSLRPFIDDEIMKKAWRHVK